MTEERLRKIITQVLLSLEREEYLQKTRSDLAVSGRQAYVLCESDREKEFLHFLRQNKASLKIQATAILESEDEKLIDTLIQEELCQKIARQDVQADSSSKLSIYPSMKRAALCEAGLGMDHTFTSMWLRKDFEMGRKSVILIGGLEPFTGLEPKHYRELILSYVKNLMQMDVRFLKEPENILKIFDEFDEKDKKDEIDEIEKTPKKTEKAETEDSQKIALDTDTNLLMAKELKEIPFGATIVLKEKKIISPMARDVIRDRKLTVKIDK